MPATYSSKQSESNVKQRTNMVKLGLDDFQLYENGPRTDRYNSNNYQTFNPNSQALSSKPGYPAKSSKNHKARQSKEDARRKLLIQPSSNDPSGSDSPGGFKTSKSVNKPPKKQPTTFADQCRKEC
jgi:hypothetical protein